MTTILLSRRTVTAAELAKRFGVSTRTIYRDVEVLSSSGVPIYCAQGMGGGISVLEEYTVDRAALTASQKESIMLALQTLQATRYPEMEAVLEKLSSIFKSPYADWIAIDFAPWGSNPDAYHKFTDIKAAITSGHVIEIVYLNADNERSIRKIEPLRLIFKSHAWYVWGFCRSREDYRTFRVSRIKKVTTTDETFDRSKAHEVTKKLIPPEAVKPLVHLVIAFTKDVLYRLGDDFDDEMIKENADGTVTLEFDFPEDEWVYGYILSFGPFAKVLEPKHIQDIIKERSQKVAAFYE